MGSHSGRSVHNSSRMVKLRNTPLAKVYQRVPRIMQRMEQNRLANEGLIKWINPFVEMTRLIRGTTDMANVERRVESVDELCKFAEHELSNPQKTHNSGIKGRGLLMLPDLIAILDRCKTDPDPRVHQLAMKTLRIIKKT